MAYLLIINDGATNIKSLPFKSIYKIKRIILFFILSTTCSSLFSQHLELRVLGSLKEPLPYSYIFINNKYYGDADSCGMIVIPNSLIKTGDTISVKYVGAKDNFFVSVSYLGMEKSFVIFDRKLCNNPIYKFNLKSNLELSEILIIGDVVKFFKKNVEPQYTLCSNHKFTMNFDLKRSLKNIETFNATGTITISFSPSMKNFRCLNINSVADSSYIVPPVVEALYRGLGSSAPT